MNLKNINVTVVCLTIISVAEIIANKVPFFSLFLWIGYGLYVTDKNDV